VAKKCSDCGRSGEEVHLNRKGRCPDCAFKRVAEAGYQMHMKEGPYYDHWLQGMKLFLQDAEQRAK